VSPRGLEDDPARGEKIRECSKKTTKMY